MYLTSAKTVYYYIDQAAAQAGWNKTLRITPSTISSGHQAASSYSTEVK